MYIKPINEQKIKKQDWAPQLGNNLFKKERDIINDLISKYKKIDEEVFFPQMYREDFTYYLFVSLLDYQERIQRQFYCKLDDFNQLVDYIKLYLKIPINEYVSIIKKYNFTTEDFPKGYSDIILNKLHINKKEILDLFFSELSLSQKVEHMIKNDSYDLNLIKKYLKNTSPNFNLIYPILLKHDPKKALELFKYTNKYSECLSSYVVTQKYDEELLDYLLKKFPHEFLRFFLHRRDVKYFGADKLNFASVLLKIYPKIHDWAVEIGKDIPNDLTISYIKVLNKKGSKKQKIEALTSPKTNKYITIPMMESLLGKSISEILGT
jgi:hypothetical protein